MQAAQVAVGQARRDDDQQEQRAERGPLEPGAAAVGADRAQAEQPLADGEAADRGQQVDLEGEQQQGDRLGLLVVRVRDGEHAVPDDARGDQVAKHPVDDQRGEPPAHRGHRRRAGHRQAESLARVIRRIISRSSTGRGYLGRVPVARIPGSLGHRSKVSARPARKHSRSSGLRLGGSWLIGRVAVRGPRSMRNTGETLGIPLGNCQRLPSEAVPTKKSRYSYLCAPCPGRVDVVQQC